MKNSRVTAYTPDAIREAGELIAAAILKGGGSGSVSWEQIVTTGTKIAEITINGEVTEVYAPNGGGSGSSVSWNEIQLSGVKIAEITIDGTTYDVYAPDPDAEDIDYDNSTSGLVATNVQSAIDEVYVETHANSGNISDLNTEVGAHDTAIGNLQTAVSSKANESIIAPVEASLTASRAYAIGDQFIYSGTLYTATAAITSGGTITIDGNCTASDTITEQIANAENMYSTEHIVGKWIDGKTLYEKTVDTGALPNSTTNTILVGISNFDKLIQLYGVAYHSNNNVMIPLPFAASSNVTDQVTVYYQKTSDTIAIKTTGNLSAYSQSYVTLRYTKTS